MRFRDFLNIAKTPILIISAIMVLFTFLSYFFGFQLTLIKDKGLINWIIHDIFYQFDLTNEANFATWFECILFFFNGMALFLLGWSNKEKLSLQAGQRLILKIMSIVFFFFSADEMVSIHEQIGKKIEYTTDILGNTEIAHAGYSWVIVYFPLAIIGIIIFALLFRKLIANVKNKTKKRKIKIHLTLFLLAIPVILILEIIEGYLGASGGTITISNSFEEFLEIFMLLNIYYLSLELAEVYKL